MVRNVSSVVLHPEYSKRTVVNTIALLFLEVLTNQNTVLILTDQSQTEFDLNNHIDTICLPGYKQNYDDRQQCYVKGWGKDKFGAEGSYQVVMKEVEIPMVTRDQCQDSLRTTRLGRR